MQILQALNHIHKQGIVHRDVKPENIMIDINYDAFGPFDTTCKLTGFGMAFEKYDDLNNRTVDGTDTFMSPETIKGQEQTSAIDIWSVGVTAFIMLTLGSVPFKGKNRERKFENILDRPLDFDRKDVKHQFEALYDQGRLAKDFITRCLNKIPEERPTA